MSKQAPEFEALSEKMGRTLRSGPLQKIFRKNWDKSLESWTNLEADIIKSVEEEIKKMVLPSLVPRDDQERDNFYACLTRLINDAWNRSWRNMRHAMARKRLDKETTPNEAVSNKTPSGSDGETIPNEPTLNEIPNEVASSGAISDNAESNEIFKTGTGVGSFRPW